MSLESKIQDALKEAMKAKDAAGMRTLRAVKTAITLQKTEKGASSELSADQENKLLQKLVKQRRDSLAVYRKENRDDLAQKEQEEIEVLERFLPKQLTAEELEVVLKEIITKTGMSTKKDMGPLMGIANKQLAGVSNGQAISAVLKNLLQ